MPIDPSTILYALPKPGGREAVLLRRLWSTGVPRLEITVARRLPSGVYHAVRGVGIAPDMLKAFAEAAPAAVGAVLASSAQIYLPTSREWPPRPRQRGGIDQ